MPYIKENRQTVFRTTDVIAMMFFFSVKLKLVL